MNTTINVFEQIDLRKEKIINLKKEKGIGNQKAQVKLIVDRSESMRLLYENGTVQSVVERVLPFGLAFDDNAEVDVYAFHNRCIPLDRPMTLSNIRGYVDKYFKNISYGGTQYAPFINHLLEENSGKSSKGVFGKLFGMGTTPTGPYDYPIFAIVITDGANSDIADTKKAIIEASHKGMFFPMLGVGGPSFPQLETLDELKGRLIDNVSFDKVPNLDLPDEVFMNMLMKEFPDWLKLAKAHNLIK